MVLPLKMSAWTCRHCDCWTPSCMSKSREDPAASKHGYLTAVLSPVAMTATEIPSGTWIVTRHHCFCKPSLLSNQMAFIPSSV